MRAFDSLAENFRGGPGRGRSQKAEGMVKVNHHAPMRKRTRRRENVEEDLRSRIMTMARVWTMSAAM